MTLHLKKKQPSTVYISSNWSCNILCLMEWTFWNSPGIFMRTWHRFTGIGKTQGFLLCEHIDALKFLPTCDQCLDNFDEPDPLSLLPSYFLDRWTSGFLPQVIRFAVVNNELLHALQWLVQLRLLLATPLTPHLLRHTIDGTQDATCLSWGAGVSLFGGIKWTSQIQILQLNKDDLSVGAQYFFIVTSTFTTRVGQQENHQDTTE